MAWINYQKAFYGVHHNWIIKSVKLTGIHNKTMYFITKNMSYWERNMRLYAERS